MAHRRGVAVVTGASAGVGRETARRLADEGWDVGLIARGDAGLDGAAHDVRAAGRSALPVVADTSREKAVERAADRVTEELGPIDVWVNNAMVTLLSPVVDAEADEYRRVTEVCYLGYVHGTRAALRRMRPRDRGVIVQVGSALAFRGIPLQSAYCAAKHAVRGFTGALRAELAHERSGVRVTEVHLPAVNTPQFGWMRTRTRGRPRPVAPVFDPAVAARAIAHAVRHPRHRGYLVGASTVGTVAASRLAPHLVDLRLGRTGFAAQQRRTPVRPDRGDNLFSPLDTGGPEADRGARGPVDAEARSRSLQAWADRHRGALASAVLLGAAATAAAVAVRRRL
ncbi:SDR family oxidoreductase [Nocardiopsis suaedae]|uniref:SDR family oxidoreductase n=1 Tax=Nocardiopsis suaedae TaxID=3018444 RepID=A0ABT4TH79_9ACTN|nr:SDR family oxidoreductase [Nocardiopsis suaedae]MDA2804052.1 SDR family oxidoreductase [Nocardiopsis suaedae]